MSFAVNMARREWRSTVRRLGVYMMSITVGVGALVALHSFRNDVVRSINEEGHVMGKKTIAEFVENDAIREKLAEIGVDMEQGYGIGKPVPFAEVV